jgi:hypothetical protein
MIVKSFLLYFFFFFDRSIPMSVQSSIISSINQPVDKFPKIHKKIIFVINICKMLSSIKNPRKINEKHRKLLKISQKH